MCWMCDHPTATRQDYHGHIRLLISDCGWAVQGVERESNFARQALTRISISMAG